MDKTDNKLLTNQPETGTVPPLVSSRVVGCWRVVAKAVFDAKQPAEMDESEIFVSGRVGSVRAKSEEVEAAMTPPGELALTLGVGTTTAARGGSLWPAVMAHFVNNAGTVVQAKVFGAEWIRQEMNASGPWEAQDFGIAALCAVGLGVTWWTMRRLASWSEAADRYVERVH